MIHKRGRYFLNLDKFSCRPGCLKPVTNNLFIMSASHHFTNYFKLFFLISIAIVFNLIPSSAHTPRYTSVTTGAERVDQYLHLLEGRKVGVLANHTSMIGGTHLVDSLLSLGVNVIKIFTPEHGFRGTADAGERISSSVDPGTGLPVISLYGTNYKPSPSQMEDLDIVVFDIQDVGVRFYTYISTMHYMMESCAENSVAFLVLDRPNPNGFYVDGPVLDMKHRSFVGMHPVPVVHGMTVAEYARMINGEGWLVDGIKADLHYVVCEGYDHLTLYNLPVRPSPNLQTQLSIYLYPSLCLFEGTIMSVGRGTDFPFLCFGHPRFTRGDFHFIPESREGARNPPYSGEKVNGVDLRDFQERFVIDRRELYLEWLIFAYKNMPRDLEFFNNYFNRLIGNDGVREMIERGVGVSAIINSWKKDVAEFKKIRRKYLLYKDFE